MSIKVIADVHGAFDALEEQLEEDDIAILLGDYVNLIDFKTLDGVLAEVYSRELVESALELFAGGMANERDDTRARVRELVAHDPGRQAHFVELLEENYERLFSSIRCRAYLIYGNTDSPEIMKRYAGDNVELVEVGEAVIDGIRFGFVSGSPHSRWTMGLPGELPDGEYDRRIASLGKVDVLCSHYPPAIPSLSYDTIAQRDEEGSTALLEYNLRSAPAFHYFGHVHHPASNWMRIGETLMVNAGFFREHRTAIEHPFTAHE